MKKVVILLVLLISLSAVAKPVSEKDARRVAYHFLANQIGVAEQELEMVYSQKLTNAGHTAFYTFATPRGGFAIVAGDDVALPILAYSYENPFGADVPEHLAAFLADLAGAIDAALEQKITPSLYTTRQWNSLLESPTPRTTTEGTVGPLLTTKWSQVYPYNAMCPSRIDSTGATLYAKVGCFAVALGQLIRFWQYPTNPRGTHSYSESDFGNHTVCYDSVSYDFTLMPNQLVSTTAANAINETARFLFHCGVSVDMQYGISSSAAFSANPVSALVNYFGYDSGLGLIDKNDYADTAWISLLKSDLRLNRPILYRGTSWGGGHMWVCDGYDATNHFHFNMGHGGGDDGWFLVSPIDSLDFLYVTNQQAIIGIFPDSSSRTIVAQKWGQSIYYVSDTLDVFKQRVLNARNGYTTSSYSGQANWHTMTFIPHDTTKQLQIELIDSIYFFNPGIRYHLAVYDGQNKDILIDGPSNPRHEVLPEVSSLNAITVVDSSSMNSHGYAFRITIDKGCRRVKGLKKTLTEDTVILSWSSNGITSQWQVEYGVEGFALGTGIVVNVSDTSVRLTGLLPNATYDYYVRASCGNNEHGAWTKLSDKDLRWTEIITSQPAGFILDENGNITISTSEGLAWLVSYINGLNGLPPNNMENKIVSLVSNIDLSPYQWTSINGFRGTFFGNNHIINNLYINGTENKQGFFGETHGNIINTHLTNASVTAGGYVGILCGDKWSGLVDGCSVQGTVNANNRSAGGLIGILRGDTVRNCFANALIVVENDGAGGLIGQTSNIGRCVAVENCYSSGNTRGMQRVGGLIGNATKPYSSYYQQSVQNCYTTVYTSALSNTNPMHGTLIGHDDGVNINKCYAPSCNGIPIVDSVKSATVSDTVTFATSGTLTSSVSVENIQHTTLLSALNAWVSEQNDTNYLTWIEGSGGLPIFGPRSEVTLYSLSVITGDSTMGTVSGSGTYMEDSEVVISATANAGFRFLRWSDGNTDNPRTITMTGNAMYIAIFEANPQDPIFYSVTVFSNNEAYGMVSGGGLYEEGSLAILSATPNSGCHFICWQDGNTENPRSVQVIADVTYTAVFEANTPDIPYYTLNVVSNNNAYGTTYGSGIYEAGTEVILIASPFTGYQFVNWQDGNTDNPRTIIVTSDATFVATFQQVVGIVDAEKLAASIHPNPASTTVTLTGLEPGAQVTIVDLNGREISKFKIQNSEFEIDVTSLASGAYYVRITGQRQQAVRKLIVK